VSLIATILRYAAPREHGGHRKDSHDQDLTGAHARKFSQPPERLLRAGLLSPVVPVDVQPAANTAASTTATAIIDLS
jgi:hypothetical protein